MPSPCNAVVLTNFNMKKFSFALCLVFAIGIQSKAQTDAKLMERLNEVLQATRDMNLEKILDMTYPKLFNIAPREAVGEAMKAAYDSEEFSTTLDSIKIEKIFPVFTLDQAQYVKIYHSMLMRMKFKEEIDSASVAEMLPLMEEGFGAGKVRFDKKSNTFVITDLAEMVAIKDEYAKEWCFVNYDAESEMVTMLFSAEVIEKLKEFKYPN